MGKIRRIIPFGMWPANWGLSGTRREKALAEYYWEGEDLAYRLLEIDYPDTPLRMADKAYRTAKLNLDYRYHKIGEFEYGQGLIENNDKLSETDRDRELAKYLNRYGRLSAEDLEYKLFELSYEVKGTETYLKEKLKLDVRYGKKTQEEADHELLDMKYQGEKSVAYYTEQLELEYKHGNITRLQYEKEVATLNKEPWFDYVAADKKISGAGVQAAVEIDWNEFFVDYLEEQGWTGNTPDEIIDNWFSSMMRQQFDIYQSDMVDDGSDDPMPMAGMNRTKRDDGLTEYR